VDLRKLRYFAGVVEAKSITKAAASLHVAQPALSKSIRSLEQDLGAVLLQRSPQGVAATEAGIRLYDHCQILFKQVDKARLDVLRSVEKPSGQVVVGMPHSLMAVLALPLLEQATKRFPEVRLELKQDQSHVLAAAVRTNKLDFAVIASPRSSSGLACQTLLIEELFFIELRQDDIDDAMTHISFADASRRQFVLPTVGNGLRAYVEGHFRARSLFLDVRYEIDAIALITQCVEAGLGVSLLPGGCLERDPAYHRLRVRSFDEGGCHRRLVLCHSEEAMPNTSVAKVVGLVAECAQDLMAKRNWLGGHIEQPVTLIQQFL
jgi:LysR family transcriptional regulator, nitrogen assimilation regulatory protein